VLALERATAAPAPTNVLRDLLWRSLHLSGWRPGSAETAASPRGSSERALLERFVHGDAEAFESLVDSHGGTLLGLARRSLSAEGAEYVEDAVQEAFLALFSRTHEVIAAVPERNVLDFLLEATRLEVGKILRQRLHDEGPVDALLSALPAGEPQPLEQLLGGDGRERAELLLETCTALEQEVVLMMLGGRATAEIAAALELEADHVRVLERRARMKLAAALAERAS